MRLLTTRAHAALDYLLGALLLGAPWLFHFAQNPAATGVSAGIGAALLVYSALTQYELALARRLDIPVHLWLDGGAGLLLAVSPWLFGFDRDVWAPHVAIGVLLVVAALLTDTLPGYDRRGAAGEGR